MVTYTPYNLRLTPNNIKHLLSGHHTVLDESNLHGNHVVYLNKRQGGAVNKARHTGKPFKLTAFSMHQMKHNIKGGSIFTDLMSKGKNLVSKGKKALGSLARQGIDLLESKATELLPKMIDKESAHYLSSKAKGVLHKLGLGVMRAPDVANYTQYTGCGVGHKQRSRGMTRRR